MLGDWGMTRLTPASLWRSAEVSLHRTRRRAIEEALALSGGLIATAARILDIPRGTLRAELCVHHPDLAVAKSHDRGSKSAT